MSYTADVMAFNQANTRNIVRICQLMRDQIRSALIAASEELHAAEQYNILGDGAV